MRASAARAVVVIVFAILSLLSSCGIQLLTVIDFLVKTRRSKAVRVKVILGLFARRQLKTHSGDFTRRITNALASDSTRRASRRTDHSRRAQSDGSRVG